jgi:hypothetical protein
LKNISDDNDGNNSTMLNIVATTIASVSGTTADPTPDDDDPEMNPHERQDEINDSEFQPLISLSIFTEDFSYKKIFLLFSLNAHIEQKMRRKKNVNFLTAHNIYF